MTLSSGNFDTTGSMGIVAKSHLHVGAGGKICLSRLGGMAGYINANGFGDKTEISRAME